MNNSHTKYNPYPVKIDDRQWPNKLLPKPQHGVQLT